MYGNLPLQSIFSFKILFFFNCLIKKIEKNKKNKKKKKRKEEEIKKKEKISHFPF